MRFTPISGTRPVFTPFTFSRHSSLAQPNGNSLPRKSRMASLMLGSRMMKPAASPSISANQVRRLSTSIFSVAASARVSASVVGVKPQLPDQASLRMPVSVSTSASKRLMSRVRRVTLAAAPLRIRRRISRWLGDAADVGVDVLALA